MAVVTVSGEISGASVRGYLRVRRLTFRLSLLWGGGGWWSGVLGGEVVGDAAGITQGRFAKNDADI